MDDLAAFRRAVQDVLRTAGRTQQQLARSIGLHPNVLSHKLNGKDGSLLTARDTRAVLATLVAWGAVTTRQEADALLRFASVSTRAVANESWYSSLPGPPTPTVRPSWRLSEITEPLRPVAPPQPLTAFIGRAAVVAAVSAAVRDSRLVTLTGVGGAGKTRVALEVAGGLAPEFADGVAFVDLSTLGDPGRVGVAVAQALGLSEPTGGDIERQLAEALRPAEVLLLIDNMEHVVDGSDLLGRLLTRAPRVHVLATSRVPLHLYGEHRFRVPPLTLPDDTAATAAGIRDSEAVQLFLSRARLSAGLDPHGEALEAVAAICTALDGLPLAIELAAAQTRLWSPRAIHHRLGERLGFLRDNARDLPQRHRSLQATLEWSEALLSEPSRRLFALLGVFTGPFDASGAAAIAGQAADDVLTDLTELIEHNLVEVAEVGSSDGPTRFRMLESVREFAAARLAASGELDAARRAHLRHYVALATGMDTRGLGPVQHTHLDRLQVEGADVHTALGWVCAHAADDPSCLTDGIRLATALTRVWNRRWSVPEGRMYLQRLLDAEARFGGVPPDVLAAALIRAAMLSTSNGDFDKSRLLAGRCLELSTELGDQSGMSWAHSQLGEAALANDDLDGALAHFTAQLDLARRAADEAAIADAYNMLGQTSGRLERYTDAETQLSESVAVFRRLGNLDGAGSALDSLADIAFRRWDIALAASRWAEALRLHWQTGNRRAVVYHLEGCAKVLAVNDRPEAALRQVSAAQRLRASSGWVLPEPELAFLEQVLAAPLSNLSSAEREEAIAAGRRSELPEVVQEALAELDRLGTPGDRTPTRQ